MNTKYPLLWSALCLALGIMLYDSFPSFFEEKALFLLPAVLALLLLSFLWKGKKGAFGVLLFFIHPCLRYGTHVSF